MMDNLLQKQGDDLNVILGGDAPMMVLIEPALNDQFSGSPEAAAELGAGLICVTLHKACRGEVLTPDNLNFYLLHTIISNPARQILLRPG